ncbi:MAG TPA: hypothetical protein VG796_28590 [Verrucomicrobiales bacterium]|nr:hypothetical protein [Verrucomicrobiales bacterium]
MNIVATDPKKLKAVVEKEKVNWLSVCATEAMKAEWNNPGTPSFYVIDHRGVIRHKWLGVPGEHAMDAALEKLIGEVPGGGRKEPE